MNCINQLALSARSESKYVNCRATLLKSWLWRSLTLSLLVWGAQSGPAQVVNSWTNPASAKWESPSWSLGTLPASDQLISINNAGYKAVNIDSATVANFPSSLTIDSLEVGAPTNALSTLLLNSFGQTTPLKVLGGCVLWNNGTLLNLSSSFEVDGMGNRTFVMYGGTFTQEGGLTVVPSVQLQSGTINATNATMNLGPMYMASGNVHQSGGTVLTAGLQIDSGTYNLMDGGTFYSLNGTLLMAPFSRFEQFGGACYGDVLQTDGYYHLYDGYLRGNLWRLIGYGTFIQYAGAAEFTTMQAWGGQGGPNYQINAGTLGCGTLDIHGIFRQYNGTVYLTNSLYMPSGIYDLVGGTVFMPSLIVSNNGVFNHYGGTNIVAGDAVLYHTGLLLEGGRFSSVNLGIGQGATVGQFAGSNEISGVLSITGNYFQQGGVLTIGGMYFRGTMSIVASGGNPAPLFINHGLINFGGTLVISTSETNMGQLGLSTNGAINLGPYPLLLRFADSSALNWDPSALLEITGWAGSYTGGGASQLYFGNSSTGLSPGQLAQIRFLNPAGSPPGHYRARILSTGEVVPDVPVLSAGRSGDQLVLTWSGNYPLLSATNVSGPFEPVPGAASPYASDVHADPSRFFMLGTQ